MNQAHATLWWKRQVCQESYFQTALHYSLMQSGKTCSRRKSQMLLHVYVPARFILCILHYNDIDTVWRMSHLDVMLWIFQRVQEH